MKMKTQETKMSGIQVKPSFDKIDGITMLILGKSELKFMTYTFTFKKYQKENQSPSHHRNK